MVKRIVSKDTGLGFGICLMIIVHLFTHQIGKANPDNFVPIVSQMSILTLITLLPLMVMGTWGSAFTMLSCCALTIKVKKMDSKDNKTFNKFLVGRILAGFLIVGFFRLFQWIFHIENADSIFKDVNGFKLNFASNTLDSIAIVGVIIPLIVFVVLKFEKLRNVNVFTGLFVFLTFLGLLLSAFIIPWGRELSIMLNDNEHYYLEYLLSKFVYGRFKVAYTFSFGCMGAFLGYLLDSDIREKFFTRFMLIFSFIFMGIAGIVAIFDWTFILEYANLDTPLVVQFFNLGAEGLVFSSMIKFIDLGDARRRKRNAKRTIWLRRYGIVSLTIYSIGLLLADGMFWLAEKVMGPAVDFSSTPILLWNTFQIYAFIVVVFLAWEITLRLWEKLHYIFSIEWLINMVTFVLRLKKNPSLYIKECLYLPVQPEFYEPQNIIEEIKPITIIPL